MLQKIQSGHKTQPILYHMLTDVKTSEVQPLKSHCLHVVELPVHLYAHPAAAAYLMGCKTDATAVHVHMIMYPAETPVTTCLQHTRQHYSSGSSSTESMGFAQPPPLCLPPLGRHFPPRGPKRTMLALTCLDHTGAPLALSRPWLGSCAGSAHPAWQPPGPRECG